LVAERSKASVAYALKDGFARVASAPAVAIGIFGVMRLLDLLPSDRMMIGNGARRTILLLLFWSFAYGGLIDRYARNRPTRARGFFGACGGHLMPLVRLGVVALLVGYALQALDAPVRVRRVVEVVVDVAMLFAGIRLVVEDRRSALGSLAAGIRFVRRNLVAVGVLWIVVGFIQYVLGSAQHAWVAYVIDSPPGAWTARVVDETFNALSLWQSVLFPSAAGIALFQARLAHAGYTAAPPAIWPESASAEAIANAAPRIPS
jgi:hypothetical protein